MSKYILLLAVGIVFLTQPSLAQVDYSSAGEQVAFDGFDLITYFDGEPLEGKSTISYKYKGLNLVFDSKANRSKFIQDPEKYLPAYGGYCAIAMVYGNAVRPDFSKYKVQNGKLMFFEVKAFFNGQTHWDKDPVKNEILAEIKFQKTQSAP